MTELSYIHRVMRCVNPFECDEILWNFNECGQLRFLASCSDIFWWGTADCEEVTADNLEEFERAYADVLAIGRDEQSWAQPLFAARVRKMRPQGAAYPKNEQLAILFDACGPERETGLGNPRPRPAYEAVSSGGSP